MNRIDASSGMKRPNSSGRPSTASLPASSSNMRQAGELLAAGHLQAALELHQHQGGGSQGASASHGGAAPNKLAAVAGSLSTDQMAALLRKAMANPGGAMLHKRVATEYSRKYGTSGGVVGGPKGPQRRWTSGEVATAAPREVLSQIKMDAPVNSSLFAQINNQHLATSRPSTQSRLLGKQVGGPPPGPLQHGPSRPGTSSAPKPHRSAPYKPGMVVMPPGAANGTTLKPPSSRMSSSLPASSVTSINHRPPTSSGRLQSRPSTSNPITHTLLSQPPPPTPSHNNNNNNNNNSSSSGGCNPAMGNTGTDEPRVATPNFFRPGHQASMASQRRAQTAGASTALIPTSTSTSTSRPGVPSSSYGARHHSSVAAASPPRSAPPANANATGSSSSPHRSLAGSRLVGSGSDPTTLNNPGSLVHEGQAIDDVVHEGQAIDDVGGASDAPTSIQQMSAAHGEAYTGSAHSLSLPPPAPSTPLPASHTLDTTAIASTSNLGLPPRPPGTAQPLDPYDLPATPSGTVPPTPSLRPDTAASDFSTAGLAMGRQGLGGLAHRSNLGSSCGSRQEGGRPDSACADSVDLCFARLKADHNKDNTLSINLFSEEDANDMDTLSLSDFGIKGGPGTPWMAPKPNQRVVAQTKKAAQVAALKWKAQQALIKQAAPMVLSLENMVDSTPEVLEMELGRMTLDELLDLDARVHATAASNSRKRAAN